MTWNIHRALAALVVFLLLAPSSQANAQAESGAQSLLIDPSVRASAMGRSSNAVFWGHDTNDWSNPSLLAYRNGVTYEWGRTQLVPDLAEDVFFTTKRLTVGVWGAGLRIAGKPIDGLGGLRLDYGKSFATDPDGNIVGTFHSFEDTRTIAAGVNVVEFAEHALRAGGREITSLSRFGDVAVGWSEKRTHVSLAPGGFAEGLVTTHDSGVLARLTPYDGIDHAGFLPGLDRVVGARLDVSYGGSTQNYNNATIAYIDANQADPIVRIQIKGWATHAALDAPRWRRDNIRSSRFGWLIDVVSPIVSAGITTSKQIPLFPGPSGGLLAGERIENSGWEVTIANIYSIRGGKIDDPMGTVQGHTRGWGIGLHLKDAVGFSYDRATIPQSIYLVPVHRKSITVTLNPIGLWERIHGIRTKV